MEQHFLLPVHYNGQDIELPMRLETRGYVYRFIIEAGEVELVAERDEEGNLRLLTENPETGKAGKALTEAIISSLRQII